MCQSSVLNTDSLSKIDAIVEKYRGAPGALIPVLHAVQAEFGYLSQDVQARVAECLNIPAVKVSGVVSFYHFFTDKAKGRFEVGICMGTACYVRGAAEIVREFEKHLGIKMGETTKDQKFTLSSTRCIGACGLAPVVTVNDDVYGKLTVDKVKDLVQSYREK